MGDGRWISAGQKVALARLLDVRFGDPSFKFLLGKLIGREVVDIGRVTREEWHGIRDEAFPLWQEDNWEVKDSFRSKVNGFKARYLEDVLGQGSLFSSAETGDEAKGKKKKGKRRDGRAG